MEVARIALVKGINLATRRNLDLWSDISANLCLAWIVHAYIRVSQDELSESGVKCIAVYTITRRQD